MRSYITKPMSYHKTSLYKVIFISLFTLDCVLSYLDCVYFIASMSYYSSLFSLFAYYPVMRVLTLRVLHRPWAAIIHWFSTYIQQVVRFSISCFCLVMFFCDKIDVCNIFLRRYFRILLSTISKTNTHNNNCSFAAP